jgi:hypothetical protein
MPASIETAHQILEVLGRYMSQEQVIDVVDAMYREVKGNKSVMATLETLYNIVHNMH